MTQLAPPGPSSGPNGSVPFGQGGALDQLHQRLREGPMAEKVTIPPPQSRPQGVPNEQTASVQAGAGPVQPPPPQPQPPQGPVGLLNQQPTPAPWRRNLQVFAQHPEADPHLRALGALSALDQVPANVLRRLARGRTGAG